MSLRHLRTLVAVADTRTFTAAAAQIGVTHAAVSQQMRALEAETGLVLFDRSGRTPALTPVAHDLVTRARKLIADYDALVPAVQGNDGLQGRVKIGALRTTLTGLTPRAMADLKARYPDLRLHIRPGLTQALLRDLERGDLDAAIVTVPHLTPAAITVDPITDEPMQLIAAAADPSEDPLHLLRHRPFIRFNRDAVLGTLIENWLIAQGIAVTETMELDSPEAIASMVQANLGVSIVPVPAAGPADIAGVKRIDLGDTAPRRTLGLAYRKDQVKTRLIAALAAALTGALSDRKPLT